MLAKIGLLSFSNIILGSTFGYDELLPLKINVVKESKLYDQKISIDKNMVLEDSCLVSFTYNNSECSSVNLIGSWDNW
jgi:hypothetical protein